MRLALARARASGVSFDDAWRQAFPGAIAGLPAHEAHGWADALNATRDSWRRAYTGEPVWKLIAAVD